MPDYSLPNVVTLIAGQSTSGKSTLAYSYLLNVKAACRFIFDWKEIEASRRLRQPSVCDEKQCDAALPSRTVCFNPFPMFGADLYEALRWYGRYALDRSKRGPGPKIFYVDELWKFTDSHNAAPDEIEDMVRGIGRTEGLQFLSSTQHPRDYHRNIRAEVTEWILFNTIEPGDLDAVRPYFSGVDIAAILPLGQFVAYNRNSRGILSGIMEPIQPGWPPGRFRAAKLPSICS